jgi:hypothetical protein
LVSTVYNDPESIKGIVTFPNNLGTEFFGKAGALEYGAHRGTEVRAYRRTITEAFGRSIPPTRINVGKGHRIPNIDEYAYLRASLAGMETEINAELTEALNEIAKD